VTTCSDGPPGVARVRSSSASRRARSAVDHDGDDPANVSLAGRLPMRITIAPDWTGLPDQVSYRHVGSKRMAHAGPACHRRQSSERPIAAPS